MERFIEVHQRSAPRDPVSIRVEHITAFGRNTVTPRAMPGNKTTKDERAWVTTVAGQLFEVTESYGWLRRAVAGIDREEVDV